MTRKSLLILARRCLRVQGCLLATIAVAITFMRCSRNVCALLLFYRTSSGRGGTIAWSRLFLWRMRVRRSGKCCHAPERHGQCQHQRHDQQRNALAHILFPFFHPPDVQSFSYRSNSATSLWASPPSLLVLPFPKQKPALRIKVIPSVAGCTTGSLCPRCPYTGRSSKPLLS